MAQTSSTNSLQEGLILACGNPLLDISAVVDEALLRKYDLKPNDAILAEDKHKPLKDELIQKYKAEYIAGGSAQNTSRVIQWVVQKPNVVTYFGCVGKDGFADILESIAKETGVNVRYQYDVAHPTGTCAVLITGNDRSLCADLAAANHFTIEHIRKPENVALIEKAQYFYITGFFLTVSPPSIMEIAEYARNHEKPFVMNLSAQFLCKFFKAPMMEVLPYVDVLFGNDDEAMAFAEEQNLGTTDLKEIALKISQLPKIRLEVPRTVVITCGPNPVIYATNGTVKEMAALPLKKEELVDTNGAGDAFAGGFLAYYIQKRPLENCILCGINTATHILKKSGCTYEGKFNFINC